LRSVGSVDAGDVAAGFEGLAEAGVVEGETLDLGGGEVKVAGQ
jgi:hypothetical protein